MLIECFINGVKPGTKYPPEVREFCLALEFKSTSAYKYVRNTFENHLPAPSTIRTWYSASDMDCGPGINEKCLDILKQKAEQRKAEGGELICSLIFDEMAIRKHIQYSHSSKKILGLVTYGNNTNEPIFASQVIVFMVSGIDEYFQIPIAYHFISSIDKQKRAELLSTVIDSLHNTGVIISNVTFDGHPSNKPMCEILGANLNIYSSSFQPHIIANNGAKISIILDPSHMIKLVRNTLGNHKVLRNEHHDEIKYNYLEQLVEYTKKGFAMTHKLNQRHMQWGKNKMNVAIAVQMLSSSTADSIDFLMQEGYEEFKDAEPSIEFIRMFNNLFDIFNTKSTKNAENPFKTALCEVNIERVRSNFDCVIQYIKGLTIKSGKNAKYIKLCRSRSKTAFTGFIINITSLLAMYEEFVVQRKLLSCIPTYHFSQDHVELFFCMCRSLNGFNDNPTEQQYSAAFRKLLVNNTMFTSEKANCRSFQIASKPFSDILTISSVHRAKTSNQINYDDDVNETELSELHEHLNRIESLEGTGMIESLRDISIIHIANIIETKIKSTDNWKCDICEHVLEINERVKKACTTAKYQDHPCVDTFKICKAADRYLKIQLFMGNVNFSTIHYAILKDINVKSLYTLTDHNDNHKLFFVKSIIDLYIQIKGTYIAKYSTLGAHNSFIRSQFLKLIHFRGQ